VAIDRTTPIGPAGASALPRTSQPAGTVGGASFGDLLNRAGQGIQLSRHAQKRIERRDLDLDPARLTRLNSAIDRAAAKGSRNSVVMLDGLAVVVDVRDRTVVTAMNAQEGKEKVFTNIDSVVIA
jgi:flagellar operon protein